MAVANRVVLIIEYDGTGYYGFQLQAGQLTIQEELEQALGKLTGHRHRVVAASRTDAGVHARGQVVSFRTDSPLPLSAFVGGLNYYLPDDIAVKAAYRVADAFHVQRDAVSREYHYYIWNSPTRSPFWRQVSYLVAGKLDIAAMNEAGAVLIGEHDLASFASQLGVEKRRTIRRVYHAGVEKTEELVVFKMVASSFLPHQVRNTVGVLVRVGLGKMSLNEVRSIMEAKRPGLAGPTAPACGLCLERVNYPVPFEERGNEDLYG